MTKATGSITRLIQNGMRHAHARNDSESNTAVMTRKTTFPSTTPMGTPSCAKLP